MSANVLWYVFFSTECKNPLEGYKMPNGKAPPERGTFFGLHVYKRVGFHSLKYIIRVKKSVISFFGKTTQESSQRNLIAVIRN